MSTKTHGKYAGVIKKKIDNSDIEGKKVIRDWCLEQMGGAANCTVLELYGGQGKIYDACYANPPVKKHMAFEIKKGVGADRPTWVHGDNKVLLPKYVQGWDLYDLDAYTEPWQLALVIAHLRKPGRFALALTCGVYRPMHGGALVGYLRQASGYNGLPQNGLLCRFYEDVIQACFNDWGRFGVTVEEAKRVHSISTFNVKYYGVIVNKAENHG